MTSHICSSGYQDSACLLSYNGVVVDLGYAFTILTGYSRADIVQKSISEIFKLLKINNSVADLAHSKARLFLYTKSYESIEFVITIYDLPFENEKLYLFTEKPNSRLSEKLNFFDRLFVENNNGRAVFSTPDMVLLKANQKYLDFFNMPFNTLENSLGKSIEEILTGYHGSCAETFFKTAIEKQQTVLIEEFCHDKYAKEPTYWDGSITPIIEHNTVKYIYVVLNDITQSVNNRVQIEEQKRVIEQKNEQLKYQKDLLETVIENISEAFSIFDKNGNLVSKNAAARRLFPQEDFLESIDNIHNSNIYYNLDGTVIPKDSLPSRKALRGETARNEIVCFTREGKEQIIEVNSTPIFDKNKQLISLAVFQRDITEQIQNQRLIHAQREQMLQAEKEKNESLNNAMQLKDEFLSLISHEFKTPITIIYSAVQVIEQLCKDELTDKAKKFLNMIKSNTFRQLRLVNNLLDLTRMNAGQIELDIKNYDIVFITKSIVESACFYSMQKGILISIKSTFKKKVISIDEEKYERILLNLLSNAIKFTPTGKHIFVTISSSKGFVKVKVKDEGLGIPRDKLGAIFEPFGQVDHSLSRPAEGTGIGLSLVKTLAEALGGSISVKSHVDSGSDFTLLLPASVSENCNPELVMQVSFDSRLMHTTAIEFSDIYLN